MSRCGPDSSVESPAGSGPALAAGGYRGQTVALLTQHGKERVIAPVIGMELSGLPLGLANE